MSDINILENILKINFNPNDQKDILESFALFQTSNDKFKYNLTYFTDSFTDFFDKMNTFQSKAKICNMVLEYLNNNSINNNLVLVFDNIFICKSHSLKYKLQINENDVDFSLYKIDKNKIILKCEITTNPIKQYVYEINCKNKEENDIYLSILDYINNFIKF